MTINDNDLNYALSLVKNSLNKIGININMDDYDMLLVKELPDADILKKNKSDKTTGKTAHIALTNEKMDIFPYLESYDYFYNSPEEYLNSSKGRFLLEVPVNLYRSNLIYLGDNSRLDETEKIPTTVTVVRRRSKTGGWSLEKLKNQVNKLEEDSYKKRLRLLGYEVQVELSGERSGVEFKKLRDLLYSGYFLIILKYKEKIQYDIFAMKPEDGKELKEINYTLYTLKKTVTVVSSNLWTADADTRNIVDGGENLLIYGVPGSGKSCYIEREVCTDADESSIERVVFHPDYSYDDFVGQILPKVSENKVRYEFTKGPFTSILKAACSNPGKKFYLIIEEINRGNAPAIFGDIFQLLDRRDKPTKEFPVGTSEYAITNSYIADEVYENDKDDENANHKIRIPPNLTIVATMNTADQNVFTLDTAFQRRWNMKLIQNKFTDDHKFAEKKILESTVKWKDFVTSINNLILEKNTLLTSSEDKRLGVYFIKEDVLKDKNKFAEKVLKYLWDDAFKLSRNQIFTDDCKSLEDVIDIFTTSEGDEIFNIFLDKELIVPDILDGETSE